MPNIRLQTILLTITGILICLVSLLGVYTISRNQVQIWIETYPIAIVKQNQNVTYVAESRIPYYLQEQVEVEFLSGIFRTQSYTLSIIQATPLESSAYKLKSGDMIILKRLPGTNNTYAFYDHFRLNQLLSLLVIIILLAGIILRQKITYPLLGFTLLSALIVISLNSIAYDRISAHVLILCLLILPWLTLIPRKSEITLKTPYILSIYSVLFIGGIIGYITINNSKLFNSIINIVYFLPVNLRYEHVSNVFLFALFIASIHQVCTLLFYLQKTFLQTKTKYPLSSKLILLREFCKLSQKHLLNQLFSSIFFFLGLSLPWWLDLTNNSTVPIWIKLNNENIYQFLIYLSLNHLFLYLTVPIAFIIYELVFPKEILNYLSKTKLAELKLKNKILATKNQSTSSYTKNYIITT